MGNADETPDERFARLRELGEDVGLLVLRISIGLMMLLGHGLPKLMEFSEKAGSFPDPLGVGSTLSLTLAIVGEVGGSILLVLGLGTRVGAVPFLVTMMVAVLVIHGDDPWARKELALLYAVPALALLLAGPGRFSFDRWIAQRAAAKARR